MSRRIYIKKYFPEPDLKYNNYFISLLINKILKCGKKNLAKTIVYKALTTIKIQAKVNPILIFEQAIRNISPKVKLKLKHNKQVPTKLNYFESTTLAIRWISEFSNKPTGKKLFLKLANELLDAAKGCGNIIKKKEETHKLAKSSKSFIQKNFKTLLYKKL